MASPSPPQPPSPSSENKLDYYYFVIGLALVAIVLLVTNAIAVGCCTWFRRLLSSRGGRNDVETRQWIPAFKYRKKERGIGGEEGEAAHECAVCLSAFDEGEEVRQLPPCGHSFHADCIDMWLSSHSSCPVCRGSVLPTPSHSVDMSSQFHSQVNLLPLGEGRSGDDGVRGSSA
ncbi:probable E3 ubiquitin-protein ligase ATL44 [Phalaenopsis equestris]|uniref:probable E3 ubiquitin-protein ligase ATL44 n=1 Tax=Phalaenopsis equestris TaxID=78828 RepID=UPI0009E4E8A5|nr:probable E3 ubiquitin-protein ligase ATL44 [Phalaenopsis equestris]